MNTSDPFVEALKDLCKREGGADVVADHAHVSAENLRQIMAGTLLPSGNLRSVGIRLRTSLTKAYPDWLKVASGSAAMSAPSPSLMATASQGDPLGVFVSLITKVPPEMRVDALLGVMRAIYTRMPDIDRAKFFTEGTMALASFLPAYTNQAQIQSALDTMASGSRRTEPAADKTPEPAASVRAER